MVLSAALENSYPNNYAETPNCHQSLEMIALKKLQGIKPMGLSAPLYDSYTNNYYETPNHHKNLDMIALEKLQGIK